MSSRVLCISIVMFLLFLAACQSPTGGVVINQEPSGPREIIVNSTPAPQPAAPVQQALPAPAPEPTPAPVRIPTNVLPQQAPEVYIVPETKPAIDPLQQCLDGCQQTCKTAAATSCRQTTGTACKANCGDIIDPSACSIACSLRDARSCEPKFKEFCGAQCIKRCH